MSVSADVKGVGITLDLQNRRHSYLVEKEASAAAQNIGSVLIDQIVSNDLQLLTLLYLASETIGLSKLYVDHR